MERVSPGSRGVVWDGLRCAESEMGLVVVWATDAKAHSYTAKTDRLMTVVANMDNTKLRGSEWGFQNREYRSHGRDAPRSLG